MKDKKIRVIGAVVSLISVLAVVPLMFRFFEVYENDFYGSGYYYGIWGYDVYLMNEINIVIGVFGLIALLWDLVYGAYAIIDGRYRKLTWRIARYGYFYGICLGIINFAFIVSFMFSYSITTVGSILFLILIAAAVILKFILIFSKEGEPKLRDTNENGL